MPQAWDVPVVDDKDVLRLHESCCMRQGTEQCTSVYFLQSLYISYLSTADLKLKDKRLGNRLRQYRQYQNSRSVSIASVYFPVSSILLGHHTPDSSACRLH